MKKIKINENILGILTFILFISFFGSLLTFIVAIIFSEVSSKTSGVIKYSVEDSFNRLFIKYIEPIENKKPKRIQFTICPTCKESFNYKDLKDGKCPYCEDVDTIELEEKKKV